MPTTATQPKRPPGRPPNPGGKGRSVHVYLSPMVADALDAEAEKRGETRSEASRRLLARTLKVKVPKAKRR